jgi:hypothetical protein
MTNHTVLAARTIIDAGIPAQGIAQGCSVTDTQDALSEAVTRRTGTHGQTNVAFQRASTTNLEE